MKVLEIAATALFLLIGVRATAAALRGGVEAEESARVRFLMALHDAARAGFWLGLAGLFLGFALIDDARSFRWFAVVPIAMGGLRLIAAAQLARR